MSSAVRKSPRIGSCMEDVRDHTIARSGVAMLPPGFSARGMARESDRLLAMLAVRSAQGSGNKLTYEILAYRRVRDNGHERCEDWETGPQH